MDENQVAADAAWLAARIGKALDGLTAVTLPNGADWESLRGPICLLQDAQALLNAYAQRNPYRG